ncbi:MAG TPA: ABC transporter ATP-binding protein, partial [Methylococcaceae bacterium]|nr:ABC transporter ATP-binding protein [Methylococcaceae bacterium]
VRPSLIVCDEPTSALDVSVQAQIVRLLRTLQEQDGLSYLFISHDLGVVAELADEIAVMWQGRIVEHGNARQILTAPNHPYTQRLIAAAPRMLGARSAREPSGRSSRA